MWTPEHRRAADRHGRRYPSDLTDPEWELIEPSIPPARRGGRPRDVNLREVLNAIFYVLSTGCQWQALPKDLPPKSTVHHYFMLWDWNGTLERIHHALYVATRERGCIVLNRVQDKTGELVWRHATGATPVDEAAADAYVARQVGRDPDLWVIEIEDRGSEIVLDGTTV